MARKKRNLKKICLNITMSNLLFLEQIKEDLSIDKTTSFNMILDKAKIAYFNNKLIL